MYSKNLSAALATATMLIGAAAQAASIEVQIPFGIGIGNGPVDTETNGNCSLVEAVQAANTDTAVDACPAGNGSDSIVITGSAPGIFTFTSEADDIDNGNALPSITSPITIQGHGSTLRRAFGDSVPKFRLLRVAESGDLTLRDLALANGDLFIGVTGSGGGLLNLGRLTLENVTVTGNRALLGGGIANQGVLLVTDSRIRDNFAGDLEIEGPTDDPQGVGGGIHNSNGRMTLAGTTISGNTASRDGGGIYTESTFPNPAGVANISNTTVSGNTAGFSGGGIVSQFGQVTLTHSTVAFNTGRALRSTGRGDGFVVFDTVNTIRASILADNRSGFDERTVDADVDTNDPNSQDDGTGFVSLGDNIIANFEGGTEPFFDAPGDMPGVDPLLSSLADNGGRTSTHALAPASPAINAADAGVCPARDQRGVARPVAGDGEACDIGAYEVAAFDFGDAKAPFPVLLNDNGAAHVVRGDRRPILGTVIDTEADGQPSQGADDDGGDEDGVTFPANLTAGRSGGNNLLLASVLGGEGQLNAWIDFNGDGRWTGPGEHVATNVFYPNGVPTLPLPFQVPADAALGQTMARIRLSSAGGDAPTGFAADGEVEDYVVTIEGLDLGDAPTMDQSGFAQNYPTQLADSGASHRIIDGPAPSLTSAPDAEGDGQPSADANGDDASGENEDGDDESGIVFSTDPPIVGFPDTPLLVGADYSFLTISPSAPGLLNGWIDFNQDGDWNDVGERIVTNFGVSMSDPSQVPFSIPGEATLGTTYARFRISSAGNDSPTGPAADGEVEDYWIILGEGAPPAPDDFDFGDAPAPFPTLLTANGARHIVAGTGPVLGTAPDSEDDGQASPDASGDDNNGADDEDGVQINADLTIGQQSTTQIQVTTSSAQGLLNAWIDFNGDGVWDINNEQIAEDLALSPGAATPLVFDVPPDAAAGDSFARFRLSTAGGDTTTGAAMDGEVEDHVVTLVDATPKVNLSIDRASFDEAGGTATVTAQLDSAFNAGDVTVSLGFTGGASADDYTTSADQIVITAGNTSGQIILMGVDDDIFEGNESLTAFIESTSNADAGAQSSVGSTVIDDEVAPTSSLSLAGSPLAEAGGVATVTATLSSASTNATTIALDLAGSASTGDYTASTKQIVIAAGETSGQITLTGIDDNLFEGDESVIVTGAGSTVTATISDDDNAPGALLAVDSDRVPEDAHTVQVNVSLTNPAMTPTAIALSYAGSATRGQDYVAPDSVAVPALATTASFSLGISDDVADETDENIAITATTPASGATGNLSITLIDNDETPTVSLSIDDNTLAEDGGNTRLTATLDRAASAPVTLTLAFTGQAERGTDYTAVGDTLTIAAGETVGTLVVSAIDDFIDEPDESIAVMLTQASNASLGTIDTVTATIVDDDGAPGVSLSVDSPTIVEDGGQARVTATLSNPAAQDISVSLVLGGAGSQGEDYTLAESSLTFPAGAVEANATLSAQNDGSHEPDELVLLAIDNLSGTVSLGTPSSVGIVITDDDAPPPNGVALDQSGAVADVTIDPGTRQVALLAFGLRNPRMQPALLDQINTRLLPAPAAPLLGILQLYLDSNGDGRVQDGEPLVARVTEIDSGGGISFILDAPLFIAGAQTLNFLVTADTGADEASP